MTSPALITVFFRTQACLAINYPAELDQVTGLLHSQPRAAISHSYCTGLADNSYLGQLFGWVFWGFYHGFCFFSSKNSLLLPSCFQGKRGTSAASTAEGTYNNTTKVHLFMKLPPVRETRHSLTYLQLQKAWFMSKYSCM